MSGAPAPCPVTLNHPFHPNNTKENTVQDAVTIDHQVDTTMPSMHVPAHTGASAVPITVTSASHPPPSLSSRLFNLQAATRFIATPKRFRLPSVKANVSLAPALACPCGEITLPSDFGPATAILGASLFSQTLLPATPASALSVNASASTASLRGYSAASRASINAQDFKTALVRVRRSASAPTLETSKNKYKYRKVVVGKFSTSKSMIHLTEVSPQTFLDEMIQARGYSTANFCSLDGGYYCKPTPLQKASYGIKILQTVRTSDGDLLKRMLDCGISPNPCNAFGESVVHMVCRRGDHKLLKILLDAGCSLQVTDDFGRTPLHDACWTAEPSFACVELILDRDERLLHIVDCRGSPPLSYTRQEHWVQWVEFFKSRADKYWAPRNISEQGEEAPPALVGVPSHSRPVPDPKNAISEDLATLISAGKLEPEEFIRQKEEALGMKPVATEIYVAGVNN